MYPSAALQTKIFPTSTLGVVSKFDPDTKYSEEEKIVNEDGILSYINGVDLMTEVDVELILYPNTNVPAPLTNVTFNFADSTMSFTGNSFVITGDVKIIGTAGKVKRVGFKMLQSTNLP